MNIGVSTLTNLEKERAQRRLSTSYMLKALYAFVHSSLTEGTLRRVCQQWRLWREDHHNVMPLRGKPEGQPQQYLPYTVKMRRTVIFFRNKNINVGLTESREAPWYESLCHEPRWRCPPDLWKASSIRSIASVPTTGSSLTDAGNSIEAWAPNLGLPDNLQYEVLAQERYTHCYLTVTPVSSSLASRLPLRVVLLWLLKTPVIIGKVYHKPTVEQPRGSPGFPRCPNRHLKRTYRQEPFAGEGGHGFRQGDRWVTLG